MYKNGTIRLPQQVLSKLNLKVGDNLVLEEKHNGFIVCKIEDYNDVFAKLDFELSALDLELKKMFLKDLNKKGKKGEANPLNQEAENGF